MLRRKIAWILAVALLLAGTTLVPAATAASDYYSARTPLSIAVSTDGGDTFTRVWDLETEAGSFAYPSIIAGEDGTLYVVYTWNRERIRFASFRLER